ncbi:MAG: UDP-N-acetylmuramate--L-alanine ligase [Propionibacteriaceae bacterium]|jgi:UDP-N-acetylmuramate--alanine ligase|nr:UDP-N-acetylmuramate--L-alanine ligase [Propionibacteriaceae bacterium]
MPLLEPVELVDPHALGPVHFIAIGGAGMSGIAAAYRQAGIRVTGSDQVDSPALDWLRALGIEVHVGHEIGQLGDAQTVVISSAVREANVELAAARARGLRVWHRSAALAALMLDRRGIAVSGTHGKTTTSAMIAWMLAKLGADPSFVLGAPLAGSVSSYLGNGELFVVEADESDGSFLQYPAEVAVITNVEADHLDNWKTAQAYRAGFVRFACAATVKDVVLSGADKVTPQLCADLERTGKRVHVAQPGEPMDLLVPGVHNQRNAAQAQAVGVLLGYGAAEIQAALGSFPGTERRFQTVARFAPWEGQPEVWIVDDYAHHPTEVRATLEAARSVAPGRVMACFQPHLFTRTRDFADEFGKALALADVVVVLDIYPAREDPIPGVTGALVADAAALAGAEVQYVPELDDAPERLAALVRPGDLVLTLGAGSVTQVGPKLAARLEAGDV